MARKPRIEFGGAVYHVINRGNYRRNVFEAAGAAEAFERTLFEACEQSEWLLHAYTIMRNHYHLALETPRANLGQGIHWMTSTFCTRFNRFRKENGHLFQGRHRAILIEPGLSLARVVNYIHLNPVRAHILPVAGLHQYPWCSFRRFLAPTRPAFLVCSDWMADLGLTDSPSGWKEYRAHLEHLAADPVARRTQGFDAFDSGWAIGSESWRQDVARDHRVHLAELAARGAHESGLRLLRWSQALDALLAETGRSKAEASRAPKAAPWKVQLASEMRRLTGASIPWIAHQLCMGAPGSVRVYLSRLASSKN
jgi:REP element-mobilizing transposase RayT